MMPVDPSEIPSVTPSDLPSADLSADLSALRLNATTQSVLGHLIAHREMSADALASVAEIAPSLVSRALRTLQQHGLVELRHGRSAPAAVARA